MPGKNILVINPTDPLLGSLAVQCLLKTDDAIYCLTRRAHGDSSELSAAETLKNRLINNCASSQSGADMKHLRERIHFVAEDMFDEGFEIESAGRLDVRFAEVWYKASPETTYQENIRDARKLMKFMQRRQIPIFNYVNASCVSDGEKGLLAEGPLPTVQVDVTPCPEDCRSIESDIITLAGQSNLEFRIFRPSLLVADDGSVQSVQSDSLRRFSFLLLGFIEEITHRAPTYFRHNQLTLRLNSAPELNIISTGRAAEMILKIAAQPHTLNQYHQIASPQTIHIKEYLSAAARLLGVELGYARETEQLNAIDLLFYWQASAFDFNFENCGTIACQEALSAAHPSNDDSALAVNPESLAQMLADEYHRHKEKHSRRVYEAINRLDKGQVELPGNHALSYYVGGKGEQTLLIVNAYGQGLGYWTNLMAELMEDHRIIVWLPRGHEHESVGVNQFDPVGIHAEDLNCLLLHLDVEKCDLLGWCTGPKLLLEFYARYPEKISSMIFLNGTFKTVGDRQNLETEYESSLEPLFKLVNEMPHVAPLLIDSLKAVLLKQKLSSEVPENPSLAGEEQLSDVLSSINTSLQEFVIQPFATERSVVNYARQLLDFWSHDIAPLLSCIQVPVLLIGGECDKIASPQMSKTLASLIPLAKYLEVRGGSHYLHYEKYKLMTAIIKDFTKNPRDFNFDHELLQQR